MATDNRYLRNDCEANTGWAGDDTANPISTTGSFIQGSGALSTQLSNADERMATTQDSTAAGTFNVDFSDRTIYMNIKDNLGNTFALGGVQCVIGDGTDEIGYDVAGNDARGIPQQLFFTAFKLDVSVVVTTPGNFATYAGSEANLTHTAITQIGYGSNHLAKAVGSVDNVIMDGFYDIANDSYALTIDGGTSGTPESMADVLTDDETNGWGMVMNPVGAQYIFFAPTEFGTPSGTADSYFTATDEQWFWVGDNAGGHAVGATHFPFRLIGNSTGTNSFVATRVAIVNTGTRAQFDCSDSNVDLVKFTACTFQEVGAITFPTQVANDRFVNDCIFNDCDRVDFQSIDADGCTFNGTTDADGAIVWDENTGDVANQDNFTFNSDGTGNAIEVAPTGAGPFTYNIDGYSFDAYAGQSGTAANRIFYINPSTLSADITINLTNSSVTNAVGGGVDLSWREVGSYTGTLVIQASVNIAITIVDQSGDPIENVQTSVYLSSDDTEVMNTLTNASGVASGTFAGSTPSAVYIRWRKSSTGATRYFPDSSTGTIASSTGLTAQFVMRTDDIATP